MFWYASGRLRRVYDESLAAAAELQRADSDLYRLDPIDFGRRVAAEKDLEADAAASRQNALFDDSGNFIIYSTLLGIKACAPPHCPAGKSVCVASRAHLHRRLCNGSFALLSTLPELSALCNHLSAQRVHFLVRIH